jgi:anthraniloyl-CoA monooxygenase
MRIVCIGGGPGGLYLSVLLKQYLPETTVEVFERNGPLETFGFGVVFSDASLANIQENDPQTYKAITSEFAHWDDIDVHMKGEFKRSSGHGFSGLSRKRLLQILQARCRSEGVLLHYDCAVSDFDQIQADLLVGADGVNSQVRSHYEDDFKPQLGWGNTRFTWLGTQKQFPAFSFYFKENEHGLWRVHAYNYENGYSTFIIETTEDTWSKAGLATLNEEESARYCEALFAEELDGYPLLTNRSIWRRFPMVKAEKWWRPGVVLLGDAVHTAHFSIGSGTKLALESASVLANCLKQNPHNIPHALEQYQTIRKPQVASTQRAALVSQKWFEECERHFESLDLETFNFSLLTRSLRITHSDLKLRDHEYTEGINHHFAHQAFTAIGQEVPPDIPPPMFTPFRLRDMHLSNRIVLAPMCQYQAVNGCPNHWHLVHLVSRAVGGCALIITEMTNISETARITPGCTGLYNDEQEQAWGDIVTAIHQQSDAKVCLQLGHAGRKASTRLLWEGMDQPLSTDEAWPIVSASDIPYYTHSQTPQALQSTAMQQIINDFVQATRRANQIGFDMLELHCAHGYLLASFLSPLTNHRQDEYGGSLENRLRFPLAVFRAMRDVWPNHKPMSVRLSCTDWEEEGLAHQDFLEIVRAFKQEGCDIINTSTGQTTPNQKPEFGRLYQVPFSEQARLEGKISSMVAGGISSYTDVNSILLAGRADLCLVGRAHLFDPYWVRHAAYEQNYKITWPNSYISASSPYVPRMEWTGVGRSKE